MIKIGDKLPDLTFKYFTAEGDLNEVSVAGLSKEKTMVLIGVPAAFSPTCSEKHVPGLLQKREALLEKGVDSIAVLSVNDPFVMQAWQKELGAENLLFLGDGNVDYTRALGTEIDGSGMFLGPRSKRFGLIAKDGVVTYMFAEDSPPALTGSSVESILDALQSL